MKSVKTKAELYSYIGKFVCDELSKGDSYELLIERELDLVDCFYEMVDPSEQEPFTAAMAKIGELLGKDLLNINCYD